MQAEDILRVVETVIGKRLDDISTQLNTLNNEVSSIHGAHNEQLKNLACVDERHEKRLDALELQLKSVNPELLSERHDALTDKIEGLRDAIRSNTDTNKTQDDQRQNGLMEILKWVGIVAASIIAGAALKHYV